MMGPVAIFWDYENCRPPPNLPGSKLIGNIRRLLRPLEPIKSFRAYVDVSLEIRNPRSVILHSDLQSSGVALIHCPHNGKKDVADKMMIVDMLTFAMDNPPPATIAIITGDRDFAYAAAVLKLRGYNIIIIAPSAGNTGLKLQADDLFDWQKDVTGIDGVDVIDDSSVSVSSAEVQLSSKGEKRDEQGRQVSVASPLNAPQAHSPPSYTRSTEPSIKVADALCAAETEEFESAQTSPRNSGTVPGLSTPGMSRKEDSIKSETSATLPSAKPPNSALDSVLTAGRHCFEGAHSTVCESDDGCPCTICTRSSGAIRTSNKATNKETNVAACAKLPIVKHTNDCADADLDSTTGTPSSISSYISNTSTTGSSSTISKQEVPAPTLRSIGRFTPLIEYFNNQRDIASATRIRASAVASALLKRNPRVFEDVGVRGLKEYFEEARLSNVIVTPGLDSEGDGWIEINPILYRNPRHSISAADQGTSPPILAAASTIARFQPLITALIRQRDLLGTRQLRASIVASAMLKKDPNVYKKAGVNGMKQYIEEAVQAGLLLAPKMKNSDTWVEINPALELNHEQFSAPEEQSAGRQVRSEKPSPPRLTVDPVFKPLVERLQMEGPSYRMTYSVLGTFFKEKYPKLCKLAGVSRIKKYVGKAQEKGFVTIRGDEWFELVPGLRPV